MGLYRRTDRGRRQKVWWVSYMDCGRQVRESSGSTNKRVAEKLLSRRKAEALEGRLNLPRSHSPHLGEWTEQFLNSIQHAKTRSRYRSSINNILRHLGSDIRLADLTPERIFLFQQKRLEEGTGNATVNRDVATLSSLFTRAKKWRLVSQNPCRDVDKLNERRDRRQARPISYEEEDRLKQFSPPWLSILITLLAETGMRVHKEALPLKWADVQVDTDPSYIHVRHSKSAAGIRIVWLTSHCREALLKWRERFGPDFSPFVFPSPRLSENHITDYKKAWQKVAHSAELTDRRIYDLRATFASRANACRASNLTVAHLLGHSSTQVLPTYVKPLDENTRAVIQALDATRASHVARTHAVQ